MAVFGLYLVRNEVDILELNLRFHLNSAIDHAVVVDNGSTDGTLDLALELSRELPLTVSSEPGPYDQWQLVTRMARHAHAMGASWVLPIDADEFWVANRDPMSELLAATPADVGVLECLVRNFVQRTSESEPSPTTLLTMTMSVANTVDDGPDVPDRVENYEMAFIEMRYPPKCLSRTSSSMTIAPGNHSVAGVAGALVATEDIECLHAPLRTRSALATKIDQGRRADEAGAEGLLYWHVRRWRRLAKAGSIEQDWRANSYNDRGCLEVGGQERALVEDRRLADALNPLASKLLLRRLPPFHSMSPEVGAYALARETVPGWFSELDLRLLTEASHIQHDVGVTGDIFEIGCYCGKSAILFGYLVEGSEHLTVCDLFDGGAGMTQENLEENQRWYPEFGRSDFETQYLRFHDRLPGIVQGPSTDIDRDAYARTCRLVHIDGSHVHAIVKDDISTARAMLCDGGMVVLDDISTSHNPGSALAAWEAVLDDLVPVCLTDAKLYGTFGESSIRWVERFREWAGRDPTLQVHMHVLAGHDVPRIAEIPSASTTDLAALTPLPTFDELTVAPVAETKQTEATDETTELAPAPEIGFRTLVGMIPSAAAKAAKRRLRGLTRRVRA